MDEVAKLLGDRVEGYYLAGINPDLWVNPDGGYDVSDDIAERGIDKDRILASIISPDEYRSALNPVPKKPIGRPKKPSPTPIDRDYYQLAQGLGVELPESHTDDHGVPTSKQFKLELDLFAVCGDRLGINEMSSEVELDRVRIDLNNAKSDVCRLLGTDHSTESCIMALNQVAKVNRYSPVIEYLNSIKGLAGKDFIRNIPAKYWNNNNDFQNYLFYRKLIATVARGMNPGCEDQSLLVLKGNQGARKSSLLQTLASKNWFCGGGFDIESKDDLAKLSKFWILEMGEIDQLFSKKAAEQYKRFISEGFDVYRPPYGRMNVTKNRSSSLFATTNKSEFLNDPTGSRRYWIVECDEVIDLESVSRDRDLIWSSALDAYESGEIWRLTKEEEEYLQKVNMSYNDGDIWDSDIAERLPLITKNSGGNTYVILADVANKVLNIPTDRQTRDVKNRIAAMLRYEGFENKLIYVTNKQQIVIYEY
jgi:predicted P-loop ATPase